MARILAIDPGDRRVGLAMTDPLGMIASPFATLVVRSETEVAARILDLVRERGVHLVLVGFPVREDGYEGEGCRRSRRLLDRLQRAGVRAMLWDETGSTRQALEVARRQGRDTRRSAARRDSVAASFILSSYLEQTAQAGSGGASNGGEGRGA